MKSKQICGEAGKKLKEPNNNCSTLISYTIHVKQNFFDAYKATDDSRGQNTLNMDARGT